MPPTSIEKTIGKDPASKKKASSKPKLICESKFLLYTHTAARRRAPRTQAAWVFSGHLLLVQHDGCCGWHAANSCARCLQVPVRLRAVSPTISPSCSRTSRAPTRPTFCRRWALPPARCTKGAHRKSTARNTCQTTTIGCRCGAFCR